MNTSSAAASLVFAGLLGLVGLAGCSAANTGAAPGSGGGGGGEAPRQPSSGEAGLTCPQIVECGISCSADDDACKPACIAQGSPAAQDTATAFIACIQKEACEDEACAREKCSAPLDACVAAPLPSQGTPLPDGPQQGSVQAELVGEWTNTVWGHTDTITLNADGTGVRFYAEATSSKYCSTRITTTSKGMAVTTADKITIYASDVVNQMKTCNQRLEITKGAPVLVELAWSSVDATHILVRDLNCPYGKSCEATLAKQ